MLNNINTYNAILLVMAMMMFSVCEAGEQSDDNTSLSSQMQSWSSEEPSNCPFARSEDITGITFTGRNRTYTKADTWYPSWGAEGNMYSGWTDGMVGKDACGSGDGIDAQTGQAKITGDDPLNLKIESLGTFKASALPYQGRYPCGNLVYNGVWYHGSYCLGPSNKVFNIEGYPGIMFNWPIIGPFVGFRTSTDYGKTWQDCPHTPSSPLFGETGPLGKDTAKRIPVKFGAPHVVDFGKDMQHSPDGKAYLVAHGAVVDDTKPRYANNSWITGDRIYLCRVKPGIENVNDETKYEYFAGQDKKGRGVWSWDFEDVKPLYEWNNNCGCVTMTYNAPLKKYLLCVTEGWPTIKTMNTYILESDRITGPWKLVVYMKDFGVQAYFVNIPSKFISRDGRTAWLCYSGNFTNEWLKTSLPVNPPGSKYGMCLQEIKLLKK